ncbi:MAG: hypothetical protein JO026_01785 [Patescibacteria group bacterium]|nr:hypothetical protein [Patescibacteria group bacterium]
MFERAASEGNGLCRRGGLHTFRKHGEPYTLEYATSSPYMKYPDHVEYQVMVCACGVEHVRVSVVGNLKN